MKQTENIYTIHPDVYKKFKIPSIFSLKTSSILHALVLFFINCI